MERVIQKSADNGGVTLNGHSVAKIIAIARAPVIRVKVPLLSPSRPATDKDVSCALIRTGKDVIGVGANDCGVAIECDGETKFVARCAVAREELCLLNPSRAGANKDVDRTLVKVSADGIVGRAHERGVATDRDDSAEMIERSAIRGSELLLWRELVNNRRELRAASRCS